MRSVRLATVLLAVVVWNVVFDRILVSEGREYVHAAVAAASTASSYVLVDPWMRAAQRRGLWVATAAALFVMAIGFSGIVIAVRRLGH